VRAEDICAAVDVGRATFFRYFDSKERAFVEGVHQRRLRSLLDAIAARPAEEGPLEVVRNAFLAASAPWRTDREVLLLEARVRADSPTVQAWASATHLQWVQALADAVAPRFTDAERATARAQLLAGAAMAAVRVASEQWLAGGGRRSPIPLLEQAFDDLLRLDQR
jgi:AcrR family transcriptional regulator